MIRYIILGVLLLFPSVGFAATLGECNWDTGTGTSTTAVRGGFFGSGPGNTSCMEVFSGGPGGRNYLRVKGVTCTPMFQTSNSLGNPSVLYVRMWARPWTTSTAHTTLVVDIAEDHHVGHPMLFRTQAVAHSIDLTGSDPWRRRNNTYSAGTWYRMEFKLTQNAGANDSIEVRVDGADVTSQYSRASGAIGLDDDNGSLDIPALNYFNISTSSTYPASVVDYAGLKFADDGWIGDDEGDTTPPTLSTATIDAGGDDIALVFSEDVQTGGSYSNSHWELNCTKAGDGVGITYDSGTGNDTLYYSIDQDIDKNDTCYITFADVSDSIEDTSDNALAEISGTDKECVNDSEVFVGTCSASGNFSIGN